MVTRDEWVKNVVQQLIHYEVGFPLVTLGTSLVVTFAPQTSFSDSRLSR
jgi:hypothetical protein